MWFTELELLLYVLLQFFHRVNFQNLHKRALRTFHDDTTSSFEELLVIWEEILNLNKLMIEIYECFNHSIPPVLSELYISKEIH